MDRINGQTDKQLAQKAEMLAAWQRNDDLTPYGAVQAVALELGLHPDSVRRSLRRYGILEPNQIPGKAVEDRQYQIDEVKFLLSMERSVAEIAEALDLTVEGLIGRVAYWKFHGHADIDLGVPRWDLQEEQWTRKEEFASRKLQSQRAFKNTFPDRVA